MIIKQNLERLSLLNSEINEKLEDLERLRLRSTSIGGFDYTQDRVQTSPSNDASYTSIVAMIVEKENEIGVLMDELADLQKNIESQIYAVLSQDEYKIVSMRWFENMGWHKIANTLGYSKSTVKRKYNEAVQIIKTQDIDFE